MPKLPCAASASTCATACSTSFIASSNEVDSTLHRRAELKLHRRAVSAAAPSQILTTPPRMAVRHFIQKPKRNYMFQNSVFARES